MEAVVASNNKNKIKEIELFLKDHFTKIYSLKDLNIDIEIEENGTTFLENALIKAKTISNLTNMVAIADDSGLEVDALDKAPGVYSARYAGEPCNDENNNKKLLENLKDVQDKNRTARFVSNVVLYYPDGSYISGEGFVEGVILHEYRGNGGFGYDPLFLSFELNKTFGETTLEEKNTVSHRARALQDLINKL